MPRTFNHIKTGLHNRLLILNQIRLEPGTTRAKLAKSCDLTAATVSKVVEKLLQMGYVQPMAKQAFVEWFTTTFTGTMPSEKILQMQDSLKERGGSMLATLGERIYNEGREEGILTGMEKGMQTGLEKGRMEVARNMLSGGLSVAQVARFTGLSEELLSGLQK